MIPFTINEIDFIVKEDISILEACKYVGIKIPRFCYHETLSIAGNCRMCLVKLLLFDDDGKETEEVDDALIISCVTGVDSEIEIYSNDPMIQKAREEILEFLLINHPLDCPICDQAGECDLQDQTKHFGSNRSKYLKNKTPVEDKDFGVFIKSIMTRCIHCTRCVRFSTEIAGVDFFGVLNRGGNTEIGLYSSNIFDSEISANVIDLCPVGALTSKPYAFKARPWELKSIETIDLTDSLGSNVYVHFMESDVLRVLPKFHMGINETIITDKARFVYDSLLTNSSNNNILYIEDLKKKNFDDFDKKTTILVSEELSFEEYNILKKISIKYPNIKVRFVTNLQNQKYKNNIFLNDKFTSIQSIENTKNYIFLFSANLKMEASLINARIRNLCSFKDYFNLYSIGFKFNDSLIKNSFLNCNIKYILSFLEGKSRNLSPFLIQAENSLVVFGLSFINRGFNFESLTSFLYRLNPSLIFFKVSLYNNSSLFNYFDFKESNSNDLIKSNTLIFLKCRESSFLKKAYFNNNQKNLIWLNTYSLQFPIKNGYQIGIKHFYEENNIFFNCEFRPQSSNTVLEKNTNSFFLFDFLKKFYNIGRLNSNSHNFILEFLENPNFFSANEKKAYLYNLKNYFNHNSESTFLKTYPFKPIINNFYQTNTFTDFSKNMMTASKYFIKKSNNFF